MQFKTSVVLAVSCVSLLALSIPAFSLPSPRSAKSQTAQAQSTDQKKKTAQHAPKVKPQARAARRNATVRLVSMPVAERPERPLFGWPKLVSEARKYMGTNPTARSKLWCATFMNMVLAKAGYAGTNSDAAKSFAQYGRRISEPQIGAIAVLTRGKNGGHVGVVSGIDKNGNPIIISGNHNKRVGEATYSRSRVIAYVMPADERPGATQVAERGNATRMPSQTGLVSPITELLAAIEAEQSRPERPSQPIAQERPVETRRVAQLPPVEPHRAVQQTPEQAPQTAQSARRKLPLDPALAEFLGITDRARSARPAPQREQRVQTPASGRVANADTGLGNIFGLR
jgi:uncharacterized protein (TIGR02594 family)